MAKKIIRLTENQLYKMITESVIRILKENEGDSDPVMTAFKNWMERNNIQCGYFDWDMADVRPGTVRIGRSTEKVPRYEAEVPDEDMLLDVIDRYYPSYDNATDEELVQWFNDNAPEVDVQEFVEFMNETAKELYNKKLSDWFNYRYGEYERWLDAQEEESKLGY